MQAGTSEVPSVLGDDYIDRVFGPGGYLSLGKPDYRPRPGQIALARAVDFAIRTKGHLIAEAGTATGKSFGYSVPASFHVAKRKDGGDDGAKAIIVTAVISLQEQLVTKDLPLLERVLQWDFTYGLLKGRGQYLCLMKYYKTEGETWSGKDDARVDKRRLKVIQDWAKATVSAGWEVEEGDVNELPFEDSLLWSRYSVSSDECRGQSCRHARECFALKAQKKAKEADVVVTNYHMLMNDILVRQHTGGEAGVLPPSDIFILDEAHAMAEVARNAFGWRMTREAVRRAARAVQAEDKSLEPAVEDVGRPFFDMMYSLRRDRSRYKGFVDGEFNGHERDAGERFFTLMKKVTDTVAARSSRLFGEAGGYGSDPGELTGRERALYDEAVDLEKIHEKMESHLHNMDQFLNPWAQDGKQVFYIDSNEGKTTLSSKLVHPRDALGPTLFALGPADDDPFSDLPSKPSPVRSVVLTSATLSTGSTGKNDFSYVAYDLGVPRGYAELTVQSPFDWRKQACLVVPQGMSAPDSSAWKSDVVDVLKKTVALAGGRTLGLFTSYAMMNAAYEEMYGWCKDRGIALYRQKDMPRTELVRRFREDVSSCLFGTESFWAGVDVPGDSLSVVVIDKLPFPSRDDPVLGALSKVSKDWFYEHSLPQAIIKWRQGFGRLIRSESDRGAVVVCDGRIEDKGYGKKFIKVLPPIEVKKNISDIVDWVHPKKENV